MRRKQRGIIHNCVARFVAVAFCCCFVFINQGKKETSRYAAVFVSLFGFLSLSLSSNSL